MFPTVGIRGECLKDTGRSWDPTSSRFSFPVDICSVAIPEGLGASARVCDAVLEQDFSFVSACRRVFCGHQEYRRYSNTIFHVLRGIISCPDARGVSTRRVPGYSQSSRLYSILLTDNALFHRLLHTGFRRINSSKRLRCRCAGRLLARNADFLTLSKPCLFIVFSVFLMSL